jgi:hypothetical protein
MRKGRFNEDQIISVLKEHQAGIPVVAPCRKHDQRCDLLHVALEVWRDGGLRRPQAEGTRG